jgi:hypothetical protein
MLMARRAASADLPLHGGHVPKWLGDRMTRLGAVITEAVVPAYGRDEGPHAQPMPLHPIGARVAADAAMWSISGSRLLPLFCTAPRIWRLSLTSFPWQK